jgi:hypothetical protein
MPILAGMVVWVMVYGLLTLLGLSGAERQVSAMTVSGITTFLLMLQHNYGLTPDEVDEKMKKYDRGEDI